MSLADRLSAYLQTLWNRAVRIEDLSRIPGGASRETYRFDAVFDDGARRGLILRRDPTGSLIDTDRATEFLAYQSFHGVVPVPEPVALEIDTGPLDRPFFIMGRVDGGEAASPIGLDPYGPHADAIGCELFTILGRIARADPAALPIARAFDAPAPDDCWRRELDAWEAVLLRDERHPQPIARAALRRLRRNPPPPAQKLSVVHGDYRSGNFLHAEGKILAILDWEMAHLGDPLEDLAWCLDPMWGHFDESRAAATLPTAEAIAVWERESGLHADPKALQWWGLFNAVKGQAIWTTSGKEFVAGGGRDLVLGFAGAYTARRHDEIIADQLERLVLEESWA
jgi:aminoglycoside phosphotransferase (APT) family kinase protein